MKSIVPIILLASLVFVFGCKPSAEKQVAAPPEAALQKSGKSIAEKPDGDRPWAQYTFEQKAAFVDAMKKEVAGLNQSLDEISEKMKASSDAAQAEAKPKIAALREEVVQLNKKLDAVTATTPTTWSGLQADSEKAYQKLKDGVTASRLWISEKVAP